jgi:hypothetical protein
VINFGDFPYATRVSADVWKICDVKTKKPVFIAFFDMAYVQLVNENRGICNTA